MDPRAVDRQANRGRGKTGDSLTIFFGNDILRFADGRFVEYWTGTSVG
jgi:hypothetical protein